MGADLRRAFGLELRCELPLASLAPHAGDGLGPAATRVRRVTPAELDAAWPAGAERIVQEGDAGSPLERYAERDRAGAHRLGARGFGEALISADGRLVSGAPDEGAPGRFERFLIARVLPWTALVRGIEVFHAAAVVIAGRAVMLVGASGAGKSSLAIRLHLAGAGVLTDDVLAVDRGPDGGLRAHPGPRIAGLRAAERDRLGAADLARMAPLRVLDDKAYVTVGPPPAPAPLGAVMFITRGDDTGAAAPPAVERLDPPPPELLLASTFVLSVRTPARLANLLEICADLAATIPQYRVHVRPGDSAADTATAIRAAL